MRWPRLVPTGQRDLIGSAGSAPDISWPGGARLAVSIVLNYEEGAEPDHEDEDLPPEVRAEIPRPPTHVGRDFAVESYYEYGARVGVWRLLDMFAEMEVPTTVFACGRALERNPLATAAFVAAGHEICSHGYRWLAPAAYSREEELAAMRRAVDVITTLTGTRPIGWYSRYGPSVHTRDLLAEVGGFVYDSDSYAEDLPYYVSVRGLPFVVVPYSLDVNDIRFWTVPGFGGNRDLTDYLDATFRTLSCESERQPRMMSIGLHPRIIGRPGRAAVLREFLARIREMDGVWFATRGEIARWWQAHVPVVADGDDSTTLKGSR